MAFFIGRHDFEKRYASPTRGISFSQVKMFQSKAFRASTFTSNKGGVGRRIGKFVCRRIPDADGKRPVSLAGVFAPRNRQHGNIEVECPTGFPVWHHDRRRQRIKSLSGMASPPNADTAAAASSAEV